MTKISDENFLSPDDLNDHACVSAGRFLNTVPEQVVISQVCQDVSNTSLVIFTISLVGTYLFTPTLKILSVDGDNSYEQDNISCQFALGNYRNPTLPISTNCGTWYGTLVFDVGSKIYNYLSAQSITFQLDMVGTIPASYGVTYLPQTATTLYVWNKGVLPSPVNLTYQNNTLQVTFEYLGETNCTCNLTCNIASGVTSSLTFCPDEKQTVSLYQDPNSTDPYNILIQLEDTIGNKSELAFQSVFNTLPKSPIVYKKSDPRRIEVSILKESANNMKLDPEVQYQVVRYQGTPSNARVWKDWSTRPWNIFIDTDILPNTRYGYALRFKGIFGDTSPQSAWTEVST